MATHTQNIRHQQESYKLMQPWMNVAKDKFEQTKPTTKEGIPYAIYLHEESNHKSHLCCRKLGQWTG